MISIIIVTYNQHELLLNTLEGLAVQLSLHPLTIIEILVVDNGSEPASESIVRAHLNHSLPVRFLNRAPADLPFRPSSARNLGINNSRGEVILFLDGDCVPGPSYLPAHWHAFSRTTSPLVTIGHRIFVHGDHVSPCVVQDRRCDLSHLPQVQSNSNYGLDLDRRLKELASLHEHPMPFNCVHACNIGVRKTDVLKAGCFDVEFDGCWGYEDIELGHRLWKNGAKFEYLSDAFVYHQEGSGLSAAERRLGRKKNFKLACAKIPGFAQFRKGQSKDYYK